MATLKLYRTGASSSMGGFGTHKRAKRGDVLGWTAGTARRHRNWLWGVDVSRLSGTGYAVTLTLRDCPESAVDFHRLRRAWVARVERMGAVRWHWVIEWTARGVPHLHAAVYFDGPLPVDGALAVHWLQVVDDPELARLVGQDVKEITGPLGWLKYLSKHAGRSAAHYQRRGHPPGWDKTGRMWGYGGDWPVDPPIEVEHLTNAEYYRLRRIFRAWAIADARKAQDWKRLAVLRAAPGRVTNEKESRFQGVAEWIPEPVVLRLVEYLDF